MSVHFLDATAEHLLIIRELQQLCGRLCTVNDAVVVRAGHSNSAPCENVLHTVVDESLEDLEIMWDLSGFPDTSSTKYRGRNAVEPALGNRDAVRPQSPFEN